ncbi:hypothetical protein [Microbacterium sp. NPDC090003]|uniref:hypothetical protein n=1 Tax=Microbacterium sp. NPDC090003 TaxID=3364203 RepID=UPI00381A5390
MDQWKWNLAQAGLFFLGTLLFSLVVVAAVGVSWWAALVVPGAFLPSGLLLAQALRERRRGRRTSDVEPRP